MKNIFKIYKKDLKDIFTNSALLIVIIGLSILPSLYAWFNIKASWDPYGSTCNISVAVVNKDLGGNIFDKNVNIGDQLVDKLHKNSSLGWNFVDEKIANKGVENGSYYASIEIPENFSKDLTSLVGSNVKKGQIIYSVNEKINAIAPKITDKGASTIQLEVNETVVKTVSETIFEIFNEVGIELENQLPKLVSVENSLVEIQGKFKDINKTIDLAYDATSKISDIIKELQGDLPAIKNTINNAKNLSNDISVFLEDTKGSINDIAPIIKTDLGLISDVSYSASKTIAHLIDAINKEAENLPVLVDSLSQKLLSLSSSTKTLYNFLSKLDKFAPDYPLKNIITQIETINTKLNFAINALDIVKNQIASGQKPTLNNLNKILTVTNDINNITSNILDNFDSKVLNPINNIFEGSLKSASNVVYVLQMAEAKLPKVEDILSTSLGFSGSARNNIIFIKSKIPQAKSIVDELVDAISKINNGEDMNELIKLLKNDVLSHSEFLKQPVELVTKRLYPIENYGSAMTPFYTVLSLWVGIVLLVSLLTTEVHGNFKPSEVYFGRGLTFTTITITQALIVSIGDILLLSIQVINPVVFILISILTSIVFTFIVYSLVSVFGNVGKAIAVVLLVIQVAGSGGTFPIEVTPNFFQVVNPLLPFTHAISALRETIGGIYIQNLTKALLILCIFLIGSIVINVFLKGPINKISAGFKKKFNSSNLIGH
ncbi:MAG: YhgE/Pip domain-containing protein [Romboutsia sp.]